MDDQVERLSDRDVIDTMNDLEMMRRPWLWPRMQLPLKRAGVDKRGRPVMDVAVLVPDTEKGTFLVAMNVTIWQRIPYSQFERADLEALVKEGWVVD